MNKLTKEECIKALRYLSDYSGEEFNGEKFANAIEDLHELINEHFELKEIIKKHGLENLTLQELYCAIKRHFELVKENNRLLDELLELKYNPPLKFEELEELEGKALWDNNMKKWILLQQAYVLESKPKQVLIVYIDQDLDLMNYWEDFEENRFYRYEVKE